MLNQEINIDFNFKNYKNYYFNDLLIFNLNINKKLIFKKYINTSHVNFYNYKNKIPNIDNSFKNNYKSKKN